MNDENIPVMMDITHRRRGNTLWFGLAIVVVLVVCAGLLWVVNHNSKQSKVVATEAQVQVTSGAFVPATLEIKPGSQVTWTSQDDKPHQIAADPFPTSTSLPGLVAPEPLAKGDSYSYTFEKAGTYTYHDHLNPYKLKGTIVVR